MKETKVNVTINGTLRRRKLYIIDGIPVVCNHYAWHILRVSKKGNMKLGNKLQVK